MPPTVNSQITRFASFHTITYEAVVRRQFEVSFSRNFQYDQSIADLD